MEILCLLKGPTKQQQQNNSNSKGHLKFTGYEQRTQKFLFISFSPLAHPK